MSLNGFTWNQAELESFHPLNNGVVMLIAFTPQRSPRTIGTAFIIGAYGNFAVAVTAAHNLQGIQSVQTPQNKHHPTALPEFLGNAQILDLDRRKARAICSEDGKIEVSVIGWAFFDKQSDIAIFSIIYQHYKKSCTFFKSAFILDDSCPEIGDEVAILGFANMKVPLEKREKKIATNNFKFRANLLYDVEKLKTSIQMVISSVEDPVLKPPFQYFLV